jgi:hypothetical protein
MVCDFWSDNFFPLLLLKELVTKSIAFSPERRSKLMAAVPDELEFAMMVPSFIIKQN